MYFTLCLGVTLWKNSSTPLRYVICEWLLTVFWNSAVLQDVNCAAIFIGQFLNGTSKNETKSLTPSLEN